MVKASTLPLIVKKVEQNKPESVPVWMRSEKVRDHVHITAKLGGAVFVFYNLNIRQAFSIYLPVAIQNPGRFYAHLFFY